MTRSAYPIAAACVAAWLAGGQARADATLTMNVAMPRASSFYLGALRAVEGGGRARIEWPHQDRDAGGVAGADARGNGTW